MKTLEANQLDQFRGGSEDFFKHSINHRIIYTAGARHVFQAGEAYWLLDEIALDNAFNRRVKLEPFQVWKLTVDEMHIGLLTCEDGNGNEVFAKRLDYTDFPLPELVLWCCDGTILLPCEY